MAYVDDLVTSGSVQMVKDFIMMIQEEFTLKHVNFLTSENSVELLGENKQETQEWQHHNEFSQKFIDELLKIFEVTGKVTTRSQTSSSSRRSEAQCDKVIHQKFRSAVGKLLWMAQLRDDLKYPVKELSRSLNHQDQDIKKLTHLLKYVNQTRDFVFVMEPQLPVRNQEGKFPVQIVSYSASDWAGCQKSRKSTSESLVSVFNVNLQSTSRTQASIAHSSAESELYAMTQAAVESLATENFIQEFSSAILSSSVSIVIQTDSSAGNQWLQDWGYQDVQSISSSRIQDDTKEGKLELKKVGTHFNPSDVLTKYVPASVLGQHLPLVSPFNRGTVFKVNSQRSAKSVQLSAKPVQYLAHPQPPSTSSITPTTLSVFMLSVNFDDQEALRQRLSQASNEFPHLLVEGAEIKEIQVFFVVVAHHDSDVQANQGPGVGVIESVQRDSDSVAHDQQPPPPQNHDSRESTSQWRSWIRSCFSVSGSLSSLSWRRKAGSRKEPGESRRYQSTTITSSSSGIKSHVICLVLFILLRFCHILAQFSSSIRSIICSEVKCSALCH